MKGYPHAQDPVETKTWRIDDLANAGMNVSFQTFPRWDFSNVERTITVRLDRESLTVLFTDYDHFEHAEPHYRGLFAMVENAIPALLPQMIQLRYIAYIPVEPPSDPKEWVLSSVLGMPNLGEMRRQGSISETTFQTPEGGRLVTRCMSLGPKNLTLPPDLLPLNAKLKHDLQSKVPFLLLENVHQRPAEQVPFSAESCLSQISGLRRHNAAVFQSTVTPEAIQTWK